MTAQGQGGDELVGLAHGWRIREVQAIGAAISLRNWHNLEVAYNQLRDKMDAAGCWHEPRTDRLAASAGRGDVVVEVIRAAEAVIGDLGQVDIDGWHTGTVHQSDSAHLEGTIRVLAASPSAPDVEGGGVLADAADLLDQYASFIRTVKADGLERHPYLPQIEQTVADLRALAPTAAERDAGESGS